MTLSVVECVALFSDGEALLASGVFELVLAAWIKSILTFSGINLKESKKVDQSRFKSTRKLSPNQLFRTDKHRAGQGARVPVR